jgi:hypothetical protein
VPPKEFQLSALASAMKHFCVTAKNGLWGSMASGGYEATSQLNEMRQHKEKHMSLSIYDNNK